MMTDPTATPLTIARFDALPSGASERAAATEFDVDSPSMGYVETNEGNLPLRALRYQSRVTGLAVATTITQVFTNPLDETIEAAYVFPLPGTAAVTGCQMWVADRVIDAELKPRAEARRQYDRAIANGYRAALLEENRSETFSMKVGNVPPGESITVVIQTVATLPWVDGQWTLRLPLVVAPKYTAGLPLPGVSVGPGPAVDTDQVPDASTVTAPVQLPGCDHPVRLELSVQLDGDVDVSTLRSSLHAVAVAPDDSGWRLEIRPDERVNRDFILRGQSPVTRPTANAVARRDPDGDHVTIAVDVVAPPRTGRQPPVGPAPASPAATTSRPIRRTGKPHR